ncbi:uncharacterized protein LOC105837955 isoform X2 [Monomorium pharaonis]|uniref:uncharacterized protein LOC105837955 isoform X2 n=1 Tax=Monomorium pharaonis TaxID=307658 RepID=UPI001746529D|nr:uncharacterized protein LOC105837955 isoform X2 [Monomorium pharaonis]
MITRHRRNNILLVILYFCMQVPGAIHGHGRLMDPPSRNAMWRFGYPNPVNYNDNELFCGGYAVHWQQNKGKCGVCGDAYHLSQPRPHEAGGEFANGIIVRHYTVGQYNLFWRKSKWRSSSPPITGADSRCTSVLITTRRARRPRSASTRNMWGTCENGTEAVGCGRPETFRNCADVSIVTSTGGIPPRFLYQNIIYELHYSVAPKYSTAPLARPLRVQVCEPTAAYRYRQNMTNWCQVNCIRVPSNCPPGVCHCLNTCDAIGDIADKPGADQYCLRRCMRYPSNCPADRCNCY